MLGIFLHPLLPRTRSEREGAFDRTLGAERLGEGFARWLTNRKASAFYRIVGGVVIAAAENDVRERTRKTLREAGEAARRVQTAAVEVDRFLPSV